jgi:hypothetical protein
VNDGKAGSEMALPFLCAFLSVIVDLQNYLGINIRRCCAKFGRRENLFQENEGSFLEARFKDYSQI